MYEKTTKYLATHIEFTLVIERNVLATNASAHAMTAEIKRRDDGAVWFDAVGETVAEALEELERRAGEALDDEARDAEAELNAAREAETAHAPRCGRLLSESEFD